jgi:hypothetical protein
MSKIPHLLLKEVTILRIQIRMGLSDPLQHLLQGINLRRECLAECNKIIRLHHAGSVNMAQLPGFNQQMIVPRSFQIRRHYCVLTQVGD